MLVVLAVLTAFCPEGWADSKGIDVVLAIDTSGSMKKTDPNNLRSEASKLFISLLDEESRVALVTFDTKAKTLSPLRQLKTDRSQCQDRLNYITSDGKWTDLNQAVRHSFELLQASSREERAIIIMTDGKMDLGKRELDEGATHELLKGLVPALKREKIKIFTIAFTKFSDIGFLKLIALKTKGFFYLTEKDKDIHITYTDIYNHMIVPETLPVEGDQFYVDLSVDEMNIVVTKEDPGTDVTLVLPDKLKVNFSKHPREMKWSKSRVYEMITQPKPMVGTWHIKYGAEKGNKVFISTDLRLMTSMKKNVVMPDTEMDIEIWLQDGPVSEGKKVAIYYDLILKAEILPVEGGTAIPLLLNDDGMQRDVKAGDGIYTTLLKPTLSGEFDFRVYAKTDTFEREKQTSFYVPSKEKDNIEEMAGIAEEEEPAKEAPPEPTPEPEKPSKDGISWGWVFLRFIIINVVLFIIMAAVLGYKKYMNKRKKASVH